MKSSLPTLTMDGFVTNKRLIFYKCWEYFLVNQYSQSNTFYGSIASLTYLLAAKVDPDGKAESIEIALRDMYLRYFDKVNIDVSIDDDDATSTQFVKIAITCSDNESDTKYYLAKEIENKNGEIMKLDELLTELYDHYAN